MSVERVTRQGGEVVWRVRWRDPAGRTRAKVLGRKRDAEAFDAEIKRRRRTGELAAMDGGKETLDEYVSGTWVQAHVAHLAPTTRDLYGWLYDRHISPGLGALPLREINPEAIAIWQSALIESEIGGPTVKKAMTLLGAILQRAAESGRISSNPQRLVRKVRQPKPAEVRPLPPIAIERMRAAAGPRDAALISVLAYAGLRPGEALALRWRHVGEQRLVVDAPKTGARRSVAMLEPLTEDLAAWRDASVATHDEDPVFPSERGTPMTTEGYKSWSRRAFVRAAKSAGVPDATPYALRHSFCSLLLAEGRSVIEVARQMGHGANLTLGTYGHVIDELAGRERVSAEEAIREARRTVEAEADPVPAR
jgi:integrase